MAAPSQIQARYIAEEDRVLMRMNTVTSEEFRFWLTRRFLQRLWPVLQEALMASPHIQQQQDFSSQQAVLAFEHEKAHSKALFHNNFTESDNLPLGTDPLLVTTANFRHLEGLNFSISLHNPSQQGIDMTLTNDLLHLWCKLLDEAVQQAAWSMPELLQGVNEASTPVSAHRLN